jgi:hypothetical protein
LLFISEDAELEAFMSGNALEPENLTFHRGDVVVILDRLQSIWSVMRTSDGAIGLVYPDFFVGLAQNLLYIVLNYSQRCRLQIPDDLEFIEEGDKIQATQPCIALELPFETFNEGDHCIVLDRSLSQWRVRRVYDNVVALVDPGSFVGYIHLFLS